MSQIKSSCDVDHRLNMSRLEEKVLRSVDKQLGIDMSHISMICGVAMG